MKRQKKEVMHVAAIREGIVIDHIPPKKLFKVAALLHLEDATSPVTIGNNLESSYLGKKGIIKVAEASFSDELLNRIAIVAPNVHLNVIKDYEVVEKKQVEQPDKVVGIIRCTNEKCITNNEDMPTCFHYHKEEEEEYFACHYCGRKIKADKIELL